MSRGDAGTRVPVPELALEQAFRISSVFYACARGPHSTETGVVLVSGAMNLNEDSTDESEREEEEYQERTAHCAAIIRQALDATSDLDSHLDALLALVLPESAAVSSPRQSDSEGVGFAAAPPRRLFFCGFGPTLSPRHIYEFLLQFGSIELFRLYIDPASGLSLRAAGVVYRHAADAARALEAAADGMIYLANVWAPEAQMHADPTGEIAETAFEAHTRSPAPALLPAPSDTRTGKPSGGFATADQSPLLPSSSQPPPPPPPLQQQHPHSVQPFGGIAKDGGSAAAVPLELGSAMPSAVERCTQLFIKGIPPTATQVAVRKAFSLFGAVREMVVHRHANYATHVFVTIHFSDPAAARAANVAVASLRDASQPLSKGALAIRTLSTQMLATLDPDGTAAGQAIRASQSGRTAELVPGPVTSAMPSGSHTGSHTGSYLAPQHSGQQPLRYPPHGMPSDPRVLLGADARVAAPSTSQPAGTESSRFEASAHLGADGRRELRDPRMTHGGGVGGVGGAHRGVVSETGADTSAETSASGADERRDGGADPRTCDPRTRTAAATAAAAAAAAAAAGGGMRDSRAPISAPRVLERERDLGRAPISARAPEVASAAGPAPRAFDAPIAPAVLDEAGRTGRLVMVKGALEARTGPWPTPVPISEAWVRAWLSTHSLTPAHLTIRNVARGAAHALIIFDKPVDARSAISCLAGTRHVTGFGAALLMRQGLQAAYDDSSTHQAVRVSAIAYERETAADAALGCAPGVAASAASTWPPKPSIQAAPIRPSKPRPMVDTRQPRHHWLGDRGVVHAPLKCVLKPPEDQYSGWREVLPPARKRVRADKPTGEAIAEPTQASSGQTDSEQPLSMEVEHMVEQPKAHS